MKIVKILAFTLIFIEISLQIKVNIDQKLKNNFFEKKDTSRFNVLVIGDSVSDGISKHLEQKLKSKISKKRISITEHILPSARIIEYHSTIKSLVNKFSPDLVISMLGKSDLVEGKKHNDRNLPEKHFYENFIILKLLYSNLERLKEKVLSFTIPANEVEDGTSAYSDLKDPVGRELLESEKFKEALVYFNKELELNKSSYDTLSIISEIQLKLGMYKDATKSLKKLIERDPSDAPSYNALSHAYEMLNNYERSNFWASKGLRLFPNSSTILGRNIELSHTFGKTEDALKHTKRLLLIPSQKGVGHFHMGRYHFIKKDFNKALSSFQESYLNHHDKALIHLHLGHTYLNLGNRDKTLYHYHQSLKLDPYDENKHFNFLIRASEYNKMSLAKEYYIEDLSKNFPNEPKFFVPIARTYIELGEFKLGYQYLKKALTFNPQNPYANKTLTILRSKTNNLEDIGVTNINFSHTPKASVYKKSFFKLYPGIVQSILSSGSKLIVMQYPDMLFSELLGVKFPKDQRLTLVDNYQVLKDNSSAGDISPFFVWDAIHLTEEGKSIISENLVKIIVKKNIIEP